MARPTTRGLGTRRSILAAASGLASVEGLEGLSIGRLASELGMSKSGLFAHFGSKEELQLATIEAAHHVYVDEVIKPAVSAQRGLPRAWALCTAFLSYVERGVFPGGCFFASAMAEFDARPGPVRDAIAEMQHKWMETLARAIGDAIECGEVNAGTDPEQVAFELEAALLSANWYYHLLSDRSFFGRARQAVRGSLSAVATAKGRRRLPRPVR